MQLWFCHCIRYITLAINAVNIILSLRMLLMPDCRIWSWSPMPCVKHGPRDSVDKNRGRRPRFLSLLRPEGHVFHTAWDAMIKSCYNTLTDWFCFVLFTESWILVLSNGQFVAHMVVAKEIALLLWIGCQGTQMNNCHENLNTCFTWNGI